MLENPPIFCIFYTISVNNQVCNFQKSLFDDFYLYLEKSSKKFEKILQIAHLVPKMNSP